MGVELPGRPQTSNISVSGRPGGSKQTELIHVGSLTRIGLNFEENLPLRKKAFDLLPT